MLILKTVSRYDKKGMKNYPAWKELRFNLLFSGKMNEEHLKIKEQIQKSFLVLKKCLEQWKEASERTNKFLEKVADFADQYQCCAKVRVTDLEIARTFPDLQERLLFRIASESDRLFTQLRKQL